MSQTHTLALVHEEGGSFGISFPDFPGCISTGATFDEVVARGRLALALHVEGMIEDNEPLPAASQPHDVFMDAKAAGAAVVPVPVDLPAERVVRLNITMEERLLQALDAFARGRGTTRSGAIAEAVRTSLRL